MVRTLAAALLSMALVLTGCTTNVYQQQCDNDNPCDDQGNPLQYAPYVNPLGITILPGYPGYMPVYVGHPFGYSPRRTYAPSKTYVQNKTQINVQNNQNRVQNNGTRPASKPAPKPAPRPPSSSKH